MSELIKNLKVIELELEVRYDLSIAELISRARFDGYVNSNIKDQNFPEETRPSEKRKIKLINFGVTLSASLILKVMDELNLQPANIKELLSLAIHYPNEQEQHPAVALKSVWRQPTIGASAPCLDEWLGLRVLSLYGTDGDWHGDWWFACFEN